MTVQDRASAGPCPLRVARPGRLGRGGCCWPLAGRSRPGWLQAL